MKLFVIVMGEGLGLSIKCYSLRDGVFPESVNLNVNLLASLLCEMILPHVLVAGDTRCPLVALKGYEHLARDHARSFSSIQFRRYGISVSYSRLDLAFFSISFYRLAMLFSAFVSYKCIF